MDNSINKKKIFAEILQGYFKELEDSYQYTIDTYLGSIADTYNKKYSESFPKHIKDDEKEVLLVFSNTDKTKAVFFDGVLQVDIENIKNDEISCLPIEKFENELIEILDAYCYLEDERSAGRILVNPMNVFASSIYKEFANERMDKDLIKGFRYSEYEILSFYFYGNKGYRKIIEKVLEKTFINKINEKGYSLKDYEIKTEQGKDKQYLLTIKNNNLEESMNIQCIFKDGYYQYWNDNDDRYVSDFNLDLIIPDYHDFLTK